MAIDSLVDPFGGRMPFLVTFILCLVLLVAWLVYLFLAYWRRRKARSDGFGAPSGPDRERWLADIRQIAQVYLPVKDKESLRILHQELGKQMRVIVSERSGWDVSSWSVGDMRAQPHLVEVAELLSSWERPSFAPDPQAHAEESIDRALEMISRW
ncbi:MAG: hypothetical protein QM705_08890 [Ancrocorticia sp.]